MQSTFLEIFQVFESHINQTHKYYNEFSNPPCLHVSMFPQELPYIEFHRRFDSPVNHSQRIQILPHTEVLWTFSVVRIPGFLGVLKVHRHRSSFLPLGVPCMLLGRRLSVPPSRRLYAKTPTICHCHPFLRHSRMSINHRDPGKVWTDGLKCYYNKRGSEKICGQLCSRFDPAMKAHIGTFHPQENEALEDKARAKGWDMGQIDAEYIVWLSDQPPQERDPRERFSRKERPRRETPPGNPTRNEKPHRDKHTSVDPAKRRPSTKGSSREEKARTVPEDPGRPRYFGMREPDEPSNRQVRVWMLFRKRDLSDLAIIYR
ncbi:hypothetical protein B0T21DRAFT_365586 [Apiosordaria backusii]|uniref:Uncharacterized protein n=1 Tax=Apiosordaria backusii TaxID=314023 RepID=A0AA40EDM0_9PEZI|nr:hypothetical protein B0T21DRAFT_365586 [Apiosordaria backusii]